MSDDKLFALSTWAIDISLLVTVAFTVALIADCVRELVG